jgi:hypothetical protein
MNVPFTSARGPSDRSALMFLALLGSLLANLLLLSQLFVWRPEYVAEIKDVNRRLARIEARLGIDVNQRSSVQPGETP